ncbi:MAG: polysaccharide deacetylase family protein [Candidatus Limnocylindria bacterium]
MLTALFGLGLIFGQLPSGAPVKPPAALPAAQSGQAATCTSTIGPGVPGSAPSQTGLPGYHSAWYGQSGTPTLCPGQTATLAIGYLNTGSLGWHLGGPADSLSLGTWGPEPGQDTPSALGGVATGWPAADRPAVQTEPYVGPGQVAWLSFAVKAPQAPGVYRLHVRPLLEGRQWLEDQGVFWYVIVKADDANVPQIPPPPPPPPARTFHTTVVDGVNQIRVPALMYHYVSWLPPDPDRFRTDLTVSPADFDLHLEHLRAQGYTTITTQDLWWTLQTGAPLPARPVILTFDDGHADAYTEVFPRLRAYGMTGTFFVTLNLVGRPGYLTLDQVKEMHAGGMDIQSHALDHLSLSTMDAERQRYQLCGSRRILSDWLGKDVRHFAYPGGAHDEGAFDALAACGYLSAYYTAGGSLQSQDRMLLLSRERVRGQQGLAALVTALSR